MLKKIIMSRHAVEWLAIAGIFLPISFCGYNGRFFLEFTSLLLAAYIACKLQGQIYVSGKLLFGFLLALPVYCVIMYIYDYTPQKFFQQWSILLVICLLYYAIFSYLGNDLNSVFRKYLKLAFFLAILAILQFCIYYLTQVNIFLWFSESGTPLVSKHLLRVNGLAIEPAYLSCQLTPALAYYLLHTKGNKLKLFFVFTAVLLTFSTVTYVIIGIVLLYRILTFFKWKKAVLIATSALLLCFGFFMTYKASVKNGIFSNIILKIDQTANGFSDFKPEKIEQLNYSSYATLMNLYVATKAPSRVIGTGLGTHAQSYEKVYQSDVEHYGLNKQDAYSLLVRVFSECGIVGALLLLLFLMVNFNKKDSVNISILFILLTFLLRGGNYVLYGTICFFTWYYFSGRHRLLKHLHKSNLLHRYDIIVE